MLGNRMVTGPNKTVGDIEGDGLAVVHCCCKPRLFIKAGGSVLRPAISRRRRRLLDFVDRVRLERIPMFLFRLVGPDCRFFQCQ